MFALKLVDFFRQTDGIRTYRQELSQTQFLSRSKIKEIQWQRLTRLLEHAYQQVPYYRRVFQERGLTPGSIQSIADLKALPVLTKAIIRANYGEMLAINAKRYDPRLKSSGGSTGVPLRYFIDRSSNSYQWADAYRGQVIAGWNLGEPMARIWGSSVLSTQSNVQKHAYAMLNRWTLWPAFDSGEEEMSRWIRQIRTKRLRFIAGYVDTMVDFARYVISQELQTQLVAVFPTTAPLTPVGRHLLEKAFGCGVFDLYQSADGGLSAFECHQHAGLHIAEERCVVEGTELAGEQEVPAIVTDLFNFAMPFIRYENGDELKLTDANCPCGRELPLIKQVRGKTYHHLELPSGKRVHTEIFSYHLNQFLAVKHYCVRQTAPSEAVLEIELDQAYADELPRLEQALAELPRNLPGFLVRIIYVDAINKLTNQKYEIFVPYRHGMEEHEQAL